MRKRTKTNKWPSSGEPIRLPKSSKLSPFSVRSTRSTKRGKILQNAIFNPLSAFVIAAGIVLVGVGVQIPVLGGAPLYLQPVWWLAGVVPLWMGVVGANLANRQAGEQAVSQVLREQFDVDRIANPTLRMNVAQAIAQFGETADPANGRREVE